MMDMERTGNLQTGQIFREADVMVKHSKGISHLKLKIMGGFFLGVLLVFLFPSFSFAIPAFARKYDLSCASCHTKPPRLNAFGEAFHMAGFQIPGTEEGEIKEKRKIGHVYLETNFLNIFSLRASGNFVESFQGGDPAETSLIFPQEVEIYLSGTVTQNISYFFELEHNSREIEGTGGGLFEEKSRFGLGREFFLMMNLGPPLKSLFLSSEKRHDGPHGHGPMIMIGKIDPSTNFSYPTNRQFVLKAPGRVDSSGVITRFTLAPYAFASKFFGMRTGQGDPIEVTKEVLYNTTGDFGIDVHGMVGSFMLQAGVMQGLSTGATDANQEKDPYFMGRMNFGGEKYISGSLSGLVYWGSSTGRVSRTDGSPDTVPTDWLRYGFSGNIKYKFLDLYGAFIWDKIRHLPAETLATFDDTAFGFTIEGDYLASDKLMLSARYDQLDAGGFTSQKADGKVLTLQARYYVRDNFSLYLRDSHNLEKVSSNPLQNFRNLVALGVDFDF